MFNATAPPPNITMIPPALGVESGINANAGKTKYNINTPTCNAGTAQMVCHIHEFNERLKNLDIPGEDEHVYFKLFRATLTGGAQKLWDGLSTKIDYKMPGGLTGKAFQQRGKNWIKKVTFDNDRADQLLYLRTAKKIHNLTVEEFGTNIIFINDLANWFPGEMPVHTEEEIKIAFYKGQPEAWKMVFTSVGKNVSTTGYNEILSFMRYQESNSNYKQLRNTLNQQ
jgi:hypothetical protein